MKLRAKPWALAVALPLLSAAGLAVAQQTAPAPDVDITGRTDVALAPAEMLKQAKAALPEMTGAAESIKSELEDAREKKDVVKSLCLNDKLGQVDLALRTATDRVDGLESAVSQNDQDRARHQFTVIQVLRERVNALLSEAQQCIGEDTGFVGDSKVTVEIDPNIADTDPVFPEEPMVSAPPVLSSPTL
jgi:hypothetical protein